MKDTLDASINAFKGEVFIWEVILTVVVFACVFYFFRDFKAKEAKARKSNSKLNTGEKNPQN
jgi:preprotein translocase subunit YajC